MTSSALEVLVECEDLVYAARSFPEQTEPDSLELSNSESVKGQKMEFILPIPEKPLDTNNSDEEEELHLSFSEFEKLYKDGHITREQIRTGRVQRKDLERIKAVLASESMHGSGNTLGVKSAFDIEEEGLVDCGLKRVDSKRYNRDYVVNKGSPQVPRKSLDSSTNQMPVSSEVVKGTPAGEREVFSLDDVEDEVCCHSYLLLT